MKKLKLFILALTVFVCQFSFAQSSAVVRQYIERFKDIAIAEMQRTGVPAAITLAQGIHETGAGQSDLVIASNNHFGIKCKSDWKGESVSHDDDAKGECFRKYNDPVDSYKDHSDFLKNRPYYAALFKLDPVDYEAWAYGLKKAGYATNPKYPQILIKLIKDYNLQEYTMIGLAKMQNKTEGGAVFTSNSSNNALATENVQTAAITYIVHVVQTKETAYSIARKYEVSVDDLLRWNNLATAELKVGQELRINKKAANAIN